MPSVRLGDVDLAYDEYGSGSPLLLFAPGGMRFSWSEFWAARPEQWIDPRTTLADRYRVIAMDQRNAGRSRAPVQATDGWHSYADDAVALCRHLGIDETAVMGGCIGCSYALGFIARGDVRVTAAVLQNPIGKNPDGHDHIGPTFDDFGAELRRTRPDVTLEALTSMKHNMFGGEFVFSVDRAFVRSCEVPLLVLPRNDNFHPATTAEEIARLAPRATLVREWQPSQIGAAAAVALIRDFLERNVSPAAHQR